jgi:hypothetical protein
VIMGIMGGQGPLDKEADGHRLAQSSVGRVSRRHSRGEIDAIAGYLLAVAGCAFSGPGYSPFSCLKPSSRCARTASTNYGVDHAIAVQLHNRAWRGDSSVAVFHGPPDRGCGSGFGWRQNAANTLGRRIPG